jgi:hypothetical protein
MSESTNQDKAVDSTDHESSPEGANPNVDKPETKPSDTGIDSTNTTSYESFISSLLLNFKPKERTIPPLEKRVLSDPTIDKVCEAMKSGKCMILCISFVLIIG